MQQPSGQDAMFLHPELQRLALHIVGVSIYDQSTGAGLQALDIALNRPGLQWSEVPQVP
jgi:hypothetical protein